MPAQTTPEPFTVTEPDQNRNTLVYAAIIAMVYLTAPTLYVGAVQATLCKRLETSDTLANVPSTVYLAMAWFPVVVAWLFPQARHLKRAMTLGLVALAMMCGTVALVLATDAPRGAIIGILIAHAAVAGGANTVVQIHAWEALRRGVSEKRRGRALAFAFGGGAAVAVVGSLWAQLLLDNELFGWQPPQLFQFAYPYNYVALFSGSSAAMLIAASLVRLFRIPLPQVEPARQTFQVAVLGGALSLLRQRVLAITCLGYLLVYAGNMVQVNMSLFTVEAVGAPMEDLVGYQLSLRFGFKIAAGFFLGWLVTRTHPRLPLLVTIGLQLACIVWILSVPGCWFLVAFGLNGAGELFAVYFTSYLVSASRTTDVRRNVAFLYLISTFVGLSPVFYGWVSDVWSLRASFAAAFGILSCAGAMVYLTLPRRPQPGEEPAAAEAEGRTVPA